MKICEFNATSFPYITLFNFISIDNCIHFRRTPDEYIIFFIIEGEMFLTENNIKYHLKRGDMILLEKGLEHYGYKQSTHCTYFYIHFNTDDLYFHDISEDNLFKILQHNRIKYLQGERINAPICIPKVFSANTPLIYENILHNLNQGRHYFTSYREFYDIQTACMLINILIQISHQFSVKTLDNNDADTRQSTFIVYQLLSYINNNYEKKLSSELIEKRFKCNFDYINRIFKKETGQTIFSYLSNIRIAHAKSLLTSGNLTIGAIAFQTGFNDIYSFSNFFKKHTGFSPSNYRKTVLKNS